MPDVGRYTNETNWMSDCVSEAIHEGREQDQAVAMCLNIWRNRDKALKAGERWSSGASRSLPIAETERSWDGSGAAKRMLDRAHIGEENGNPNPAMARRGFLIYDAANGDLRGSYSCPFADIVDGTLKAIPSGLRAAASRLPQVTGVSAEVKSRARGVLDAYFGRMENGNDKMLRHHRTKQDDELPSPGEDESRDEFMERCEGDGYSETACGIAWDEGQANERRARRLRQRQDDEDEEEFPEPTADETHDDYIERCTGDGHSESVCEAAWAEEERSLRRARRLRQRQDDEEEDVPSPQEDETRAEFMERCQEGGHSESACAAAWGEDEDEGEERRFRRTRRKQVNAEDVDVPEPGEDEGREDFIDRCVGDVMDQDVDEEHASSLCALSWENRSAGSRMRHKTHAEIVNGMEFCLSDETPDRMGDIISSKGWELRAFLKNPIALFNHRSDFPIGIWENLRVEKDALRGNLKLAPAGTSERIDEIRRLIEAGILKAVSVGFKPIHSQPRKIGERTVGEHFTKQELVETSLVSVPANPNALAIAKSLDISTDTLDLVFAEHGRKRETVRTRGGPAPGKHAARTRAIMEGAMSLTKRIEETHASINALRDELTDHLANVDDSNVSDAQLERTTDLNQQIQQKQKHLAGLMEAEKNIFAKKEGESHRAIAVVTERKTNGSSNGNGTRTQSGMIAKPYVNTQRSPKIPEKAEERLELIVRAGVVAALAHLKKKNVEDMRVMIAQEYSRYGDEATKMFTAYTARAESAPAMTTVEGWAAELVQQIHGDYLELLMPTSVYPRLAGMGLALTFGRAGRIVIPTRERTPSISGSFVGEGRPIPVRQAGFTAQILTPRKMAVITTWTRELDESSIPAIEGLLRNAIQEDTAITLDDCLLDEEDADNIRPRGLLHPSNVTFITASTATPRFDALVDDLKNVTGALLTSTRGNIRRMVLIMNPQQTLAASLTAMPGVSAFPFKDEIGGGRLLSYPIIESGTVELGTVIAMDASDFVSVGGEAPRFEVSDQATLHMEDTDVAPIVSSAGETPASGPPVRSLWQTDSLGLRLVLPINWTMRRPGMVAAIRGVTW